MEAGVLDQKRGQKAPLDLKNEYGEIARSIGEQLGLERHETLRTSVVLMALQKEGLRLHDLEQAVFAPRRLPDLQKGARMMTTLGVQKKFISPFLSALRKESTLAEVAQRMNLKTLSTYHHWESGRRDIPFYYFLQAIDLFSGRLAAFLEVLPLFVDTKCLNVRPELYRDFFSQPWIPSLFMALQLKKLQDLKTSYRQADYLSRFLNISNQEVEAGLDLLARLGLVKIEEEKFISLHQQLYAIPSISPEKIQQIHQYWFSQAAAFLERPGFHKVEQHTVSYATKEQIVQWITELREKIRLEVKKSGNPETLIHINWQLVELL